MDANVVVVVGCAMVGSNNMRGQKATDSIRKQSLKINRSGCNPRSTTKGHPRMSLFSARGRIIPAPFPLCTRRQEKRQRGN